MLKGLSITLSIALLVACVDPATQHGANVFDTSDLNSRQEAKIINIVSLEQGKVKVDNRTNKEAAAVFGAIAGALLGSTKDSGHAAGGALLGGAVGEGLVPSETLVDGVKILYSEGGQILTSVQIGKMCQFATGPALVVITRKNETRVQSNAATPCVKGQEHIASVISKYQANPETVQALGNTGKGHKDTIADLEREKELLRQQTEVQREKTGLSKEKRRTETADERTDLEVEAAKGVIDRIKKGDDQTININISTP